MFTTARALAFGREGRIEEWVHGFLNDEGNNPAFSQGLKITPRCFTVPLEIDLGMIERCCGPEEGIKFPVPAEGFESRITAMGQRMDGGWDVPPLIVNYSEGRFELNDGNHRYEALRRRGTHRHHVIFWTTGEADFQELAERLGLEFRAG